MVTNKKLKTNEWYENTAYTCKKCGGEDVVSNITNYWKRFYCNDCGSVTLLAIEDINNEAMNLRVNND